VLWTKLEACAARVVDVLLLFWHNPSYPTDHIFLDTAHNRAMLKRDAPHVQVRCDMSPHAAHCHHQKFWVVDEMAFVGGMVLSNSTLDTPLHSRGGKHDVFCEFEGPSVADVEDVFRVRWGDRERRRVIPEVCGSVDVQVARSVAPGLYGVSEGVEEIWAQYAAAFRSATRSIYMENQHPGEERLLGLLADALRRGVRVVLVVPGEPMLAIGEARKAAQVDGGRYAETFRRLDALEAFDGFTMTALSAGGKEIYCHAKVCVVDGVWGTVGSANFVDLSLRADHTELNATFWDGPTALRLLRALVEEHVGEACPGDDVALLAECARVAVENAERRERGEVMQGHLYALDARGYP